jgi:chromate transporter
VSPRTRLAELARLFIRLGATSFGGPAAHIALMQDEVVRKRGWMSATAFLDALSATNLIPGPNSTELAMHVGHQQAGARGLVVAGVCFIVPAALMVGLLAAGYTRYASVPDVGHIFYGIKPVVIAIVAVAVWTLGRTTMTTRGTAATAAGGTSATAAGGTAAIAAAGLLMLAAGVHELPVLAVCGALAVAFASGTPRSFGMLAMSAMAGAAPAAAVPFNLGVMFALFLKTGAVLFGSGYVLLAFLRADFVERLGWLTEQQLLDAIAIGQITPGPLFTTATFIGYLLAGPFGAAAATVGIFLPAFVFVALTRPLVHRMRQSARTAALLDGINAGSLAMMVFVLAHLARSAITDMLTLAIAVVSLLAIAWFRVNNVWLMAAGAVVGWVGGRG